MGLWLDRGRECDNLHQAIEIQIIHYLCGTDSPVSVALNTPLDRPIDRALRGFFIRFCYPSVTRPPKWRLLVTNKPIYHSELQPILERSNRFCIDIQKRCKWCNAVFTAHKTTTEYCSHRCANLAYKDRVRKQRIESLQHELGKSIRTPPNLNKEYLTPSEVAKLLNIGRTSIYRYIHNGIIKVIRFERKTLVRRADIENMTDYLSKENEKTSTKEKAPITDFYTTAEVKEKYHVNESWIFAVAKKNNIPRTFNRGKTYWSKKHIDTYFAKKAPNPDITEWYSTQEMQEKFGMTLSAIYCFVSKNAIPKKKEGIMVYYSKKHVDIAKGIAAPEEPQYYTVAEAMEKFNLTRDQLYHYAKYHNISKVKKGKYTLISKPELDKLLAAPKIE